MFLLRCFLFAVAFARFALPVSAQPLPWPMVPYGEAPGEGVHWGQLDNGFRYAFVPDREQTGKVSIRLIVRVGTGSDPEGLAGAAHFVEHMAFRSSSTFEADELLEFILGDSLELFESVNATTLDNHTVFKLDFEEASPTVLDNALRLFEGVAVGLRFDESEVEAERAIIGRELAERRLAKNRDNADLVYPFFEEEPEGPDDAVCLDRHTASTLRQFWNEWYRPDRAILFVAGDVDIQTLDTRVKQRFSGWAPRSSVELPEPIDPPMSDRRYEVAIKRDADEVAKLQGSFLSEKLDFFEPGNELRYMIAGIVGHYVQCAISEDSSSFRDTVSIVHGRILTTFRTGGSLNETGIRNALYREDKLFHVLSRRGVPQEQLERMAEKLLKIAEAGSVPYRSVEPADLCDRFVSCVLERRPFEAPSLEAAWFPGFLRALDADAVREFARINLNPENARYALTIPHGYDITIKGVAKLLRKVRKLYDVDLYDFAPETHFKGVPVADRPTHAPVFRETEAALGYPVHRYRFENNVRLNVAVSDRMEGRSRMYLSFGDGLNGCKSRLPGARLLGEALLARIPIDAKTGETLDDLLVANDLLDVAMGVELARFFVSAAGDSGRDVESFFALTADWLQRADFGEEEKRMAQYYATLNLRESDRSRAVALADRRMLESEYRLRLMPCLEEIEALTLPNLKDWVLPALREGFCEVNVVGDVDPDAVAELAGRTLGALTARAGNGSGDLARPGAAYAKAGFEREYFPTKESTGIVQFLWRLPEPSHSQTSLELTAMARCLDRELFRTIRAREGLVYSFHTDVLGDESMDRSYAIRLTLGCDIAREKELVQAVLASASGLRDRLDEATLTAFAAALRRDLSAACDDEAFLAASISNSRSTRARLASVERFVGGEELDPGRVSALAAEILKSYRARIVSVMPHPSQ